MTRSMPWYDLFFSIARWKHGRACSPDLKAIPVSLVPMELGIQRLWGVDKLLYVFKKFQSSEVYVHLRLRSRLLMGDYSSHCKQHWHKVKMVDNSHLSRSSVEFPLLLSLIIIKHKQSVIDLATFIRTIFY